MKTFLKVLAILILIVTIAAAGVVLYGLENRVPRVETVSLSSQAGPTEEGESWLLALVDHTYGGAHYVEDLPEELDSYSVVSITVRLINRGLLPMEWIEIQNIPKEGDILCARSESAHVLSARSQGDLTLKVLTAESPEEANIGRRVEIAYYLLGQKYTLETTVEMP